MKEKNGIKMSWARTIFGGILEDAHLKYKKVSKEILRKSREHTIHNKSHKMRKIR